MERDRFKGLLSVDVGLGPASAGLFLVQACLVGSDLSASGHFHAQCSLQCSSQACLVLSCLAASTCRSLQLSKAGAWVGWRLAPSCDFPVTLVQG